MGMSNMQVQQPMQQSSGKGFGGSQPISQPNQQFMGSQQGGNAGAYFDANPDVAQSFRQNNYGMDPQTFANTHFQKYGQGEGRTMPGQQPRLGQPNPYSNTVRQWDNASIMPTQNPSGKGGGYETARTNFSQQSSSPSGKGGKTSRISSLQNQIRSSQGQ